MKKSLSLLIVALLIVAVMPAWAQEGEEEAVEVTFENVSFSYPAELAGDVEAQAVEAVPYEDNMPYWGATPPYLQFTFMEYLGDEVNFFHVPQILVYPTADFADYGSDEADSQYTILGQAEMLAMLLEEEEDLAPYAEVATTSNEVVLPHLPLFNAAQVVRAQPEYVEFENGIGIRYLSYYSQAVNPITDVELFYTFQGLTEDGEYYVAVSFPLMSGVFPEELDYDSFDYETFAENYEDYLDESIVKLNEMAGEDFTPSLETLDGIVSSIMIETE